MLNIIIQNSPLLYFTQSYWRDEVFSIFVSEHSLLWIIKTLNLEPPVYYFLLHYWMKIFGNSELGTRSLSLLAVCIATVILIFWAEKIFKQKMLQTLLPVFFILNPMIIYYAFEVRAYGLLILWLVISLYAYQEKKWKLFLVSSILGFYTHTYYIFFFISQLGHYIFNNLISISNKKKISGSIVNLLKARSSIAFLATILAMIPWFIKVIIHSGSLKYSWYYPVDLQLVKSVLGNLFIGYEGTPWFLWRYTFYLSVVLILVFIRALKNKHKLQLTSFLILNIFMSVGIVVGISFIKPLYVNRYLINVTLSEIFLLVIAMETFKNNFVQKISGVIILCSLMVFNLWYPKQHAKSDIRNTISEINKIRKPTDLYYAGSSVIYFETKFYSSDRTKTFLYNPEHHEFPWYVGKAVFNDSEMAFDLPVYPTRAFLIFPDLSYKIIYKLPSNN